MSDSQLHYSPNLINVSDRFQISQPNYFNQVLVKFDNNQKAKQKNKCLQKLVTNEHVMLFYPVDVKNHFDVLKILDAVRTY